MTFWNYLYQSWKEDFYSEPFLLACILSSIIFLIKYNKPEKIYSLFLIYSFSAFVLMFGTSIVGFYMKIGPLKIHLTEISNTVFEFLEFFVFYSYYSELEHFNLKKYLLKFSFILFSITSCIYLFWTTLLTINSKKIIEFSFLVNVMEMCFLLFYCLYYFFTLFKRKSPEKLSTFPSFWITTGLLFYTATSIPFFMIASQLSRNKYLIFKPLSSLHYISFGLLFIFNIRSLLCKKTLTT